MKLEDHPDACSGFTSRPYLPFRPKKESLDAGWLKQLVLDAGADDVDLSRLADPLWTISALDILKAFPHTKTLISFVVRMNREAFRTPASLGLQPRISP